MKSNSKSGMLKNILLAAFILAASFSKAQTIPTPIRMADSLFRLAEYDQALSILKTSVPEMKETKWMVYGSCLTVECYSRKGDFDRASEIIDILQKMHTTQDTLLALIYNAHGNIMLNKGRSDEALEDFNKALMLYKDKGNKMSNSYARCLSNLGIAYWTTGNTTLAEEYLLQALEMRKNIFGEMHDEVAASLNNLGLIYSETAPDKAESFYGKSLEIYKKIFSADHPVIALGYNNLGIIYRKQQKYDNSIENFQQAYDIQKKKFGETHPTIAFVYNNIAQTYFEKGDMILAKVYFEKALAIYKEVFNNKGPEVAYGYNMLATLELKAKNYDKSLELLQESFQANSFQFSNKDIYSFPSADDFYNANLLLSTLIIKAQALEDRHYNKTLRHRDLTYALHSLEIADTLIENIRQLLVNKNDKIALGKTSTDVYEHAISLAYTISQMTPKTAWYLEKCFYFSEKNKASVLLEAISDANAKSFANIPDEFLKREKELKADIAFYEQKIASGSDAATEKLYREKLFNLNDEYRKFTSELEKRFPQYFNLKYNVHTPTVQETMEALGENDCIISYFIAENHKRIYIFSVSKKQYKVYNTPLSEDFNKMITGMRNSIRYKSLSTYYKSATVLYNQLFPFKINPEYTHLIIIPDGRLGVIPYEALFKENKELEKDMSFKNFPYLIRSHAFSYNYSITLYLQMLQEKQTAASGNSVLLCAPVEFSSNTKLNTLPGTEKEIEQIGKIFSAQQCTPYYYKYSKAHEGLIKSDSLSTYRYLHLATHGIVNEDQPELSEIFLNQDPQKREDGNLYSGEIYNLKIDADLVTLSACETGLGKVSKGEGIIGLSRALLYAGANNIVVSLWSVNDESTSMLMIEFYSEILTKKDASGYAKALQQSKLKLLNDDRFYLPYYWAPFILIGR